MIKLRQILAMSKVARLLVAAAVMALVLPHLSSAPVVVCVVVIFSWLIAETAAAKAHYIHSENLSTPIAMTDQSKSITWLAKYDRRLCTRHHYLFYWRLVAVNTISGPNLSFR